MAKSKKKKTVETALNEVEETLQEYAQAVLDGYAAPIGNSKIKQLLDKKGDR